VSTVYINSSKPTVSLILPQSIYIFDMDRIDSDCDCLSMVRFELKVKHCKNRNFATL